MATDADAEAARDMLELLRHDLENTQVAFRVASGALAEAERRLLATSEHLRFLREEAPVVLMTEYLSARNIYRQAREQYREAYQRAGKALADVVQAEKEIADTELALQLAVEQLASPPKDTASVLEFPNANNGRDSEADPDGT